LVARIQRQRETGDTIALQLHRPIITASSTSSVSGKPINMLRINTLGGWNITRPDGTTRAIPAQRVSFLALLVAAGVRGVQRDRASALLWPESPDENARHSIGQALYAMRRDAGSPDVVIGTTTLRLNVDLVACDAWELEVAARAGDAARVAELYTGPFLDGVRLRGSAELDHLIDAERARLATLHAQALESLARAAASEGKARGAADWWKRLAVHEPLSSRIAVELVRALATAGDRTAALDAARVHETLVRHELSAAPDPAFSAFVEQLKREPAAVSIPAARDDGAAQAHPASSVATDHPVAAPEIARGRRAPRLTRRLTLTTIGAALCVGLVPGVQRLVRSGSAMDTKRVYVARFENRTGDPALGQIGGIARDWVSQGLEQSGVVAVASAARAEGVARPQPAALSESGEPAALAARLGAGTVVSGAYYSAGGALRFHVQISDVGRGEVLDAFDVTGGAAKDPSAAVEGVRQRTVGSLAALVDPRLASWVRVASRPPTYDAYREFVSGQRVWGIDRRQALGHFLRAADLDSTFYAARVEAAILHRLLGECGRTVSVARELDAVRDRLPPYEYHVLDEQVAQCEGDWERAYRQARAVVEVRPGSAFLEYSLALQAMQLGRFEEAKQLLGHHTLDQGVAEVGPNYALIYAQLVTVRGDPEKGLDVVRWLRSRHAGYGPAWAMELTFLARSGRAEAADRLADTMVATPLEPRSALVNGLRRAAASLAACGDTVAARRLLARALSVLDAPASRRVDRQQPDRAAVLYELGRLDEARTLWTALLASDSGNVDARGYLGLIAARRHDTATAAAADAWLEEARVPYVFTRTMYRARIAAQLGQRERALELLGPALDEMNRFLVPGVRDYTELASLKSDERFARLTSLR